MKTFNKVIAVVGLISLSACAYHPVLGGHGRSNGYYGQNPNYGYRNGGQGYGYPNNGGNYGYRGRGNQGYGNYGSYQQPQYGQGRHHHHHDD